MPPLEATDRLQTATVWEATGNTDQEGRPTVSAALELSPGSLDGGVRWVDKFSQAQDASGNTVGTDVTVVTNRNIPIGSIMWLGESADFVEANADDLYEVVAINDMPDIKGRFTRRVRMLKRFRSTLPTVE